MLVIQSRMSVVLLSCVWHCDAVCALHTVRHKTQWCVSNRKLVRGALGPGVAVVCMQWRVWVHGSRKSRANVDVDVWPHTHNGQTGII